MIFIDKQFCACQLKYKEQTFPIFSTLTLSRLYFHRWNITKNTCKIASITIFSTLTLSRFTYFQLNLFHKWRYKEQTFPIFSTLTFCHLYLFSSMNTHEIMKIPLIGKYQVPRIPRTHMKSFHFWFFVVTFDTLYCFFFNKIDGFYW